jgi:GTP-binding protein Era
VLGLAIRGDAQLVFVDTPGIFQPKRRLDRAMVAAAWAGAADADIVVLLVDAQKGVTHDARRIVEGLEKAGRKAILALNKIDLVKRDKLLELAAALNESGIFTDIFMISAATGDGVEDLAKTLVERLPEGPWLYPEDQLSDMAERQLAAEMTREKLFLKLRQELPYALTVETEEWEDKPDGSVRIAQVIYVQRDTQKSIVLGKGGQMIKAVGEASRLDLEEMLGCRVHLFLFVKVREKWGDDPDRYRDWGLDFDA